MQIQVKSKSSLSPAPACCYHFILGPYRYKYNYRYKYKYKYKHECNCCPHTDHFACIHFASIDFCAHALSYIFKIQEIQKNTDRYMYKAYNLTHMIQRHKGTTWSENNRQSEQPCFNACIH